MTAKKTRAVRCAIYTRVSTDQGLDQEFNSLDAQYEASPFEPEPREHNTKLPRAASPLEADIHSAQGNVCDGPRCSAAWSDRGLICP